MNSHISKEARRAQRTLEWLRQDHPLGVDVFFHPDNEEYALQICRNIEAEFGPIIRKVEKTRLIETGKIAMVDAREGESSLELPVEFH